jgi:hypothetical protein
MTVVARGRAPDRRVRLLQRLGLHAPIRQRPVLPLERITVVGPAADDVLDGFAPHVACLVRSDAEAFELDPRRRPAGAEVDSPVRKQVEHCDRLGRPHWMVVGPRHESDAVAQPHALGAARDGAVEHLGVGAVRVLLEEVVLHRPEGMESRPLRRDRLLEGVLVRLVLAVRAPGTGHRDLVEQGEPHAGASSRSGTRSRIGHGPGNPGADLSARRDGPGETGTRHALLAPASGRPQR